MRLLAVAALALGTQNPTGAQREIELRAALLPDSARIGEVVTLTLSVSRVPESAEVVFPELPDTGAVTALGPPSLLNDGEPGSRSALYELAAWDVGDLTLPGAVVRVVTGTSELRLPLPDLVVHVESVLPAGADPETLAWRPAADVMGGNWSLQEKLAGAALALALVLAAVLYLRRRGSFAPVPVPPGRPPRERAAAAFDWLEESGLAEAGELKAFYSALSQIVREFLVATDEAWGLDLTTPEVAAAVGDGGVDASRASALRELLADADLVKFSGRRPRVEEAYEALQAARRWVEEFERAVVQEEPEPGEQVAAVAVGAADEAASPQLAAAANAEEAVELEAPLSLEELFADDWRDEGGSGGGDPGEP
jgi:hypothetical protein